MKITEATIRERLAADRAKTSRLATWEEIEYLLDELDAVRSRLDVERKEHHEEMRDAGRELAEMERALVSHEMNEREGIW